MTLAKLQQAIPEMKRDGNTVMSAVWTELLFDERSTSRANGVTTQMDVIPKLIKQLQESPDSLLNDFEEIRKHSRFSFSKFSLSYQ